MIPGELAIIPSMKTKPVDNDFSVTCCPRCGSRQIGRLGSGLFYCWTCCVEMYSARGGIHVYELEADGSRTVVHRFASEGVGV